MRCHECGADVRDDQRFCHECGASLKGVTDVTGPMPSVSAPDETDPPAAPAAAPFPPPTRRTPLSEETVVMSTHGDRATPRAATTEMSTSRLPVQPAPSSRTRTIDTTGELPQRYAPGVVGTRERTSEVDPYPYLDQDRRRFRLRPLLVLAVLVAAGAVTGVVTNVITIVTDAGASPGFEVGDWKINDFGTNNTIAALLAASAAVVGALAWCFGARWGAGLAGGAGAALAGWSTLLIGLAEWPIVEAQRSGAALTITRDVGYWAVAGAGAAGVVLLLLSLAAAGRDGHSGLDPWIAALGAVSFVLVCGGPLIPQGDVGIEANYQSTTFDLPAMFFVGRAVQLGLLLVCGVVGFLSVRRFGLGLAIGGALAAGWMLVTAATDQTDAPIGPAYANPGATDLEPHAVTIVGMAMVGFFALVAVVMAVLDSDR